MLIFIILILSVPALYLWMIAPNMRRRQQMKEFHHLAFAHRGYWDMKELIPENSIAAFKEAVNHNLGIELDVHLTKDNKVVVFHDDNLKRMCSVDRKTDSMTYDELEELYLAHTAERIPLFSDVLRLVDGRVPLLIELKLSGHDTRLCKFVYEELKDYGGKYMIQSFNSFGVFWFRRHAPHVLRGQLSANLMKSKPKECILFTFAVRFLLTNLLTRPDFISYKLKDRKNPSLFLNKRLFGATIAVWTLRNQKDFDYGKAHYPIIIFEKY